MGKAEKFIFYDGARNPFHSRVMLVLAGVEYDDSSRIEHFLFIDDKSDRGAITYQWTDRYDCEIQPKQNLDLLLKDELETSRAILENEILQGLNGDFALAREYFPYNFVEISDPKTELIYRRLSNRLPLLDSIAGSRCPSLRALSEALSKIKPLTKKSEDRWFSP